MLDESLVCELNLYEFQQLLKRMSIPYTIDRVTKNILHIIIMIPNDKQFRIRFVREDFSNFKFTNFFEG